MMFTEIKGLTQQLNEAGKIKIGKKGKMIKSSKGNEFRPPKKLDHFQLVTTEKDENDDYVIDVDLQNKIKKSASGIVNKDGCLIGLPIRLLYNDTALNFPHKYVSYKSGKLSCQGNGVVSLKRINEHKKDKDKETPCPCERVDHNYDPDKKDKCKPSATLTCIIDEADLFGQAHKFRTTSMNTIKGILGGIELIKTATNGLIAGLPLMLTMNQKNTIIPGGGTTTVYVVSICYRGSMADLRQEALKQIEGEKQYLLSMDAIEQKAKEDLKSGIGNVDLEEERETIEEFFPDAIDKDSVVSNVVGDDVDIDNLKDVTGKNENSSEKTSEGDDSESEEDDSKTGFTHEDGRIKPVGDYAKVYDKFTFEEDIVNAMAFAKRLQRGNLVFWLVENYKDVEFDPGTKKPELLDLVEKILKIVLSSDSKDESKDEDQDKKDDTGSEDQDEPGKNESDVEKSEEEIFVREWDDSELITRDQKLKLVKLKSALEDAKVFRPDKWSLHVNYFLDKDGKEISSATDLTTVQGDTFIKMLTKALKRKGFDDIPF